MSVETYGTTAAGEAVRRVTLSDGPLRVALLTHGARIQDARLEGIAHSLTLGTEDLAAYEGPLSSVGALVGPVVNRIGGASAALDGRTHRFEDRGGVTLHSGSAGTHRKVWELLDSGPAHALMALTLPDGEGGFPGERRVTARFDVAGAALTMEVDAETDAPTWANFANHSYWNLDGTPTFAGHTLRVAAGRYLPTDADDVPTGEIAPVEGTGLDFRAGRTLHPGAEPDIDANLCLADGARALTPVLRLTGAAGVSMEMATTEPGVQVYFGHKLRDVGALDHAGRPFAPYRALALEAQGWPDAPNRSSFPEVRLDPGERRRQVTRWSFGRPG